MRTLLYRVGTAFLVFTYVVNLAGICLGTVAGQEFSQAMVAATGLWFSLNGMRSIRRWYDGHKDERGKP